MPRHHTLSISDLRCTRGKNKLFEDLSFQLSSAQCMHVIGPNGCGKTTLLRSLCGLRSADAGKIEWNQTSHQNSAEYRASMAYIAHKDGLKNELTAIENLAYYQQLEGLSDTAVLERHLHKLGILHCADLPAQQLSFGQRRRLAFARLLVKEFDLWILDEPFTGVDADGRAIIESLCVGHLERAGSIIMTHHQALTSSVLSKFVIELRLEQ